MLAIITLTKGGLELAEKIVKIIDAKIYYKPKPFADVVKEVYETYDQLLFIMATGIVVRTIAPHLKHKSIDPAVLVMDEKGRHVISLLSGHLGGANWWAEELATKLSATAVITTASDVNNLLSVDMFAEKYNLLLEDYDGARDVTAVLVDGGTVELHGIDVDERSYVKSGGDAVIYVSHKKQSFDKPSVRLMKKNLVLGMGCKRHTSLEHLEKVIKSTLEKYSYSLNAVTTLASAWVKNDETCFVEYCKQHNIDFKIYDQHELLAVEDKFEGSEFVKKTIGVSNVSEPSGYLASNQGLCLINKIKDDGVTLSLWEKI